MTNRRRTRFERELVQILSEQLGEGWFGQRGAHSEGVDVLMFRKLDEMFFMGLRVEVKSKNNPFPLYLSERERLQFQNYQELENATGVKTYYAIRKVGHGKKWWFARMSDFTETKNGHPCLKYESVMEMEHFTTLVQANSTTYVKD